MINSPTVLGEINRLDFLNILEKSFKADLIEEMKFVQSIPFLKTCQIYIIKKIFKNFIRKKGKINERIITQGDPINSLYILKTGQFSLQYNDLIELENGFDLNFFLSTNEMLSNQERFTGSRLHEIKGYQQTKEKYNV